MQGSALKFIQKAQSPFVDPVGHKQYFDALFTEHFELRAVFGGRQAVGGDVVNGFLAFFHAGFVVGQRHIARVGGAGSKTQQFSQAFAVGKVFAQTFFKHRSKLGIKLSVFAFFGFVLFAHHIGHGVFVCGGFRG